MSKYIHKVLVKATKLERIYQNDLTYDGTKIFKQLPHDMLNKNFYKNYKFLYLYEKYKHENRFSETYSELVATCYEEIEKNLLQEVKLIAKDELFFDAKLNEFIQARVIPLYFNKYAIYPITSLSQLPLNVRLYVYFILYQHETNEEAKCHLLNRLAVTFARLNKVDIANNLALYNWVLAQKSSSHFAKTKVIQSTLRAIIRHDEKYKKQSIEDLVHLKQPIAGIYRCYESMLIDQHVSYSKDNVMCLDLLTVCYKEYKEIGLIGEALKAYLRTKDMKELGAVLTKARIELLKASIHLPTHQLEYIMPEHIRFQLKLYDRLIQLTI